MGRGTHNKGTRNAKEPAAISHVNTSNIVLNSLQELNQTEDYKPKIIEHDDYAINTEAISSIYETIAGFAELAQKVVNWYEDNELAIKNQDQFANDMLHEFELAPPKDLRRAYMCYVRLRSSRQLRRKAKSENKILKPLYTYVKSNPTLPKDMKALCEKCAGIQYDIEHAKYYYKIDTSQATL